MENKKEIGKAIKAQLQMLDRSLDSNLWQKIAADLDHEKRKKRIIFFLLVPFLIMFLSYLSYDFFHTDYKVGSKNDLKNNSSMPSKKNVSIQNEASQKLNINQNIKNNKLEKTHQNQKAAIANDSEKVNNVSTTKIKLEQDSLSKRKQKSTDSSKKSYKRTIRLVRSNSLFNEYEVTTKQKYFFKKFKNNANRKKQILVNAKKQKTKNGNQIKKSRKSKSSLQTQQRENATKEIVKSTNQAVFIQENSAPKQLVDSVLSNQKFETNKTIIKKIDKKIKKIEDSVQVKPVELPKMWLVGSVYFGPTFYNSFGNENYVVDNQNSSKKGVLTYNYGFYLRWMTNKNIGLRLGLGKTDYHYAVSAANNNNFIETNNIMLQDYAPSQLYNIFQNSSTVDFTQKTAYYELPVEAYVIFKDYKNFEIATNFGLSLLFLDKNRTTLKSDRISELQIGSNNNIQEFGYTANLGLNFSYKITKRINFDVSPSVKYQFIELIRNSNFQPFSLDLQTGFSYRF